MIWDKTDLERHLPLWLRGFKELGLIMKVENPEIDRLKQATKRMLDNAFIQTCDAEGIEYFEELFEQIYGRLDVRGWDIEKRRRYCLWARRLRNAPITEAFFAAFVAWLFPDLNITLSVNYEEYAMTVTTVLYFDEEETFDVWLERFFRGVVPANLIFIVVHRRTHAMLRRYTHAELGAYVHNQICNN